MSLKKKNPVRYKIKTCRYCGQDYRNQNKLYCNNFCKGLSQTGERSVHWKGDKITKICIVCKKDFRHTKNKPTKGRGKKTCSYNCAMKLKWKTTGFNRCGKKLILNI